MRNGRRANGPDTVWPDPNGEICAKTVDFEGLAHVLANTCRWGGRTRRFFSIAQHAVLASEEIGSLAGPEGNRRRLALLALLEEAGAAWLGDLSAGGPVSARATDRARREGAGIDRAVREAAGLAEAPAAQEVELLRFVRLMLEAAARRDFPDADFGPGAGMAFPAIRRRIRPVGPAKAAKLWLARLDELTAPSPEEGGNGGQGDDADFAIKDAPADPALDISDETGQDDAGRSLAA